MYCHVLKINVKLKKTLLFTLFYQSFFYNNLYYFCFLSENTTLTKHSKHVVIVFELKLNKTSFYAWVFNCIIIFLVSNDQQNLLIIFESFEFLSF